MRRTFSLDNGILCHKCLKLSYNAHDVSNLYCGSCKTFHNPYDNLYEDLFGHAFIYDERHLNADSLEMHENLKAGKWLILLVCLTENKAAINKMFLYSLKEPTLLTHEIGGSEGVAFIIQRAMTDIEIRDFKRWFENTLVIGSF